MEDKKMETLTNLQNWGFDNEQKSSCPPSEALCGDLVTAALKLRFILCCNEITEHLTYVLRPSYN